MDIKSISTLSLPSAYTNQKTQSKQSESENWVICAGDYGRRPSKPKLPYVAAGVVLAGFAAYALHNKFKAVSDIKKEGSKLVEDVAKEVKQKTADVVSDAKTEVKEVKQEIKQEVKQKIADIVSGLKTKAKDVKQEVADVVPDVKTKTKEKAKAESHVSKAVKKGLKDGKSVQEKSEKVVSGNVEPAKNAIKEAKKQLNLLNDEITAKILENRKKIASDIDRIIAENTRDGHINLDIMRKVARDFSIDKVGRGDGRLHQAADILEQSHIREFLKKEGTDTKGLYNVYCSMKADPELFSIYTRMPLEEAANRLNYISRNDLAKCRDEKMTAGKFFEKMFEELVKKTQSNK